MTSKVSTGSKGKELPPQEWMPNPVIGKTKPSGQADGNSEEKLKQFMRDEDVPGESTATGKYSKETVDSIDTGGSIQPEDRSDTVYSLQTGPEEPAVSTMPKRTSSKQRKESLEEYRQTFLTVPKLEDRKPVFISCEVRDRLDEIARRLGGRGMSVSGLIENLTRHHLETYRDDIEWWKKL